MDDREPRRYLLVVKFGGTTPVMERVRHSVPNMKEVLERVSGGECQLAFTSQDAGAIGFLYKTRLNGKQVANRLQNADDMGIGNSIRSDDELLIVEVGEDFYGQHLARAWTWLQHH